MEGHLRFQSPLPKVDSCSYCRTPNIKSTECNCRSLRIEQLIINNPAVEKFENIQIEVMHVEADPDLEDKDILQILAEDEPLE